MLDRHSDPPPASAESTPVQCSCFSTTHGSDAQVRASSRQARRFPSSTAPAWSVGRQAMCRKHACTKVYPLPFSRRRPAPSSLQVCTAAVSYATQRAQETFGLHSPGGSGWPAHACGTGPRAAGGGALLRDFSTLPGVGCRAEDACAGKQFRGRDETRWV
ncbi:hypothetical protein BDZ85DRAFT_268125 [Elsinoe ampelina]|uniref:Uncharacterized protein n=1 Tax=Elsinoe ampelina TaxID=302913 RepID=A0A6A6G2J2_9PEZI|nr:hypothetical protein BDZ85DRAFT_268125 [Elsinoe ampelina]